WPAGSSGGPFLFREIGPQAVSVRRADAKRKVVRSGISEPLLPARRQSLVPVVRCQERNHTSDGSLNEQIIIGGSNTCQPHENVAIRTLHDCHLTQIFCSRLRLRQVQKSRSVAQPRYESYCSTSR